MGRTPAPPRDVRALARAAERFRQAAPWDDLHEWSVIAFRFEGLDEPWFGVVLGAAGTNYGLHLGRGETGLRALTIWTDAPDADDVQTRSEQLGFTLQRFTDLRPSLRSPLEKAGLGPRRGAVVPAFMSKRSGRSPGFPDRVRARQLLAATQGFLVAYERRTPLLDPPADSATVPCISVSGDLGDPAADVSWLRLDRPVEEFAVPADPERDRVPEDGDVAGWRRAEASLIERTLDRLPRMDLPVRDASRRYYGADGPPEHSPLRAKESYPPFAEWMVKHVRVRGSGPNVLESLIATGLPEAERRVAESRLTAGRTLVRVAALDPEAGMVTTEDVFTGDRTTFHDQGFANSAIVDLVIGMSLVSVGGVILPYQNTPGLRPADVTHAFEFLESEGLELSPAGLAARPHLLGRLWHWIAERDAHPGPDRLVNNDGDEIELCEMTLHAEDPESLRVRLGKRRNVTYDEEHDGFTWKRPADPRKDPPGFAEGGVVLGRIQVIGDEVLVTTNSRRRADRARRWLEKLPGVRYRSIEGRSWDAPSDPLPLDDRLPGPGTGHTTDIRQVPPELRERLEREFRSQSLAWADVSVPVLGGKTPREAIRTPEGRRKVTLLVRTMPAPMAGIEFDDVRRDLLAELGLAPGGPAA